jgi:NADH-quinone oxidoreductase subunit L
VYPIASYLWLIPALPLAGAILLGIISQLYARRDFGPSERSMGILAVAFPALAFAVTVFFATRFPLGESLRSVIAPWIVIDQVSVSFGFLFDDLSRIMLLFITGIGALITLYSVGYMHGDRGFVRFMAYMNLFLFSMITLVLSDNLVLTFLGWEGVGLCSYLLIGFWHSDPANGAAANKAFLVNRAGDLGFLLGIFALITLAGPSGISFPELKAWLLDPENSSLIQGPGQLLILLATFFLFWGCTAKSAQIPLLTWLPDAMAGPTPVSALIHAATMVTSGVYLLARLSDLFVLSPIVMGMIAVIGLGTAMWAAVAGIFQDDIKKVLAYSTVSQLGFMFLAAGCGAFDAAIFHVFTHAFFKAALFLGAGSVIHALAGEQDLRRMGGLVKSLPITFIILASGWIAIIGIPGTAGFWSKDLILERVYVSGPMGPVLYFAALATAILTALYMTRMMVLAFAGSFRGSHHTKDHAHESPLSMRIPMLVLAAGSLLAGFVWAGLIPGLDIFGRALAPIVGNAQHLFHPAEHHGPSAWIFAAAGTAAAVVGAISGWITYIRRIPSLLGAPGPHGLAKRWTLAFDSLHFVFAILPTRVAAWISDVLVQRTFEGLQILAGFFVLDSASVIRKLQVSSLRLQLGLTLGLGLLISILILERIS